MAEPFIRQRLAEDGQTMEFPVLKDGKLKPSFRARYNACTNSKQYDSSPNLVYLALPDESTIYIEDTRFSIPFIQKGEIKKLQHLTAKTELRVQGGISLVKIYPGVPYRVKTLIDGWPYHSFEWLETPDSYRDSGRLPQDFVYVDEKNGLAFIERQERIVKFPGGLLFPENCAFRIPGWLAKWFNGSAELGFAYSPFKEPDKNEALHYHRNVMEPYMSVDGVARLFLATQDGSEKLNYVNKEGRQETVRGEILELSKGDIVIPFPETMHKLVFDRLPFAIYCVNYTDGPLTKEIDDTDKVPVEDVKAVRNPAGLGAV